MVIDMKRIRELVFVYLFILVISLAGSAWRSEEHTSELQSRENLVCRLLLEKKKDIDKPEDERVADRLAAVGLADHALVLTVLDVQVDAGDGIVVAEQAVGQQGLTGGEMDCR